MTRINEYCEANLATVTLRRLAHFMGYTTVYSAKIIKNAVGKSFSEYIQDLRCAKAARLLVDTELPVNNIINIVGYENGSFFRKSFRKRYGLNPLEYRKKNL